MHLFYAPVQNSVFSTGKFRRESDPSGCLRSPERGNGCVHAIHFFGYRRRINCMHLFSPLVQNSVFSTGKFRGLGIGSCTIQCIFNGKHGILFVKKIVLKMFVFSNVRFKKMFVFTMFVFKISVF